MGKLLNYSLISACLLAGLILFGQEGAPGLHPPQTLEADPRELRVSARKESSEKPGAASPAVQSTRSIGLEPGSRESPAGFLSATTDGEPAPFEAEFLWAAADLEADPDPEVREQAVYRLQEFVNPVSLTLIEAALEDPDPLVREAAIDTLMEIGDAASARALIHAYFSQPEELRVEIVHALAEFDNAAVTGFLLTASHDESAAVRDAARAYSAYQAIP